MPQPIASPVTLDNAQSLSGTPKMAAQNVNFFYGSSQALFDVSLTFPERQVTALIGPSGCGKSTFLRCLNRMNDLIPGTRTEGLITLDKEDINAPNFDVVNLRRRVGMVFQTPNILPASIRQNMLLPLQLATAFPASGWRGTDGTQPDGGGALARRQFTPARTGFDTSGGQQQRLCLARTLALEPEILLLDEPTASLDPATTHTIENLLLKLAERYPILLVSHGLPQAKRMASRIVQFGKGRLQGMLSPEELPNEAEMNRFFDGEDAGNR